jgi:hypothetical protein
MSDENWIAKTIVPKSDQLNAEDLLTGPITVTVEDVKQGDSDQPVSISITGRQPYKPCKTCRRVLIAVWGERAADWIGRSMTLYADPDVKWGGVAVGGIRISHVSHIDHPHTLMLSVTRGKRKAYTVEPLKLEKPKAEKTVPERVASCVFAYDTAKDFQRLNTLDSHLDALVRDCDEAQEKEIHAARDAAIARLEEGAADVTS